MEEGEREDEPLGFHYFVSDEQLWVYASMTPDQKLQWLEEMREFTVSVAPPEAQRWWRKLREGT